MLSFKNKKIYYVLALLLINFNIHSKKIINKTKKAIVTTVLKNTSPKKSTPTTQSKNNAVYDTQTGYINIYKQGVMYSFVPCNNATDHFVKNVFSTWEPETFEIFNRVKDPKGIAIDLGGWIGTTAIWLCKNFSHVVTVEADKLSLKSLNDNLSASNCSNVTICKQPVAQTSKTFIFGPRGQNLNESISYIKEKIDNPNDYSTQGITLKQLIYESVYQNNNLKNKKISFIKCDIEGGEEDILEDILYFAYYNNVKVYISFHINWWKDNNIQRFEYLFKFFKNNCPDKNVVQYLKKNPFGSILFEPEKTSNPLVKKNIPAVIIGYNQLTYIKNMVTQLEKYTSDIIIIGNNSTYPQLLNYYKNDFKYTLLRQPVNYGHRVYQKDFVRHFAGDVYILTDPDLQFNGKLPTNFIEELLKISNHFKAYKVGFALSIDPDLIISDLRSEKYTIYEWEKQYWTKPLVYNINPSLKLYDADIDTTFSLINQQFIKGCNIRVAGDYTCLHLPWLKNFKSYLTQEEIDFYLKNNISSTWFKK